MSYTVKEFHLGIEEYEEHIVKVLKTEDMEAKNKLKKTEGDKKAGFPIPVSSYKMILIGFGIVVIGFILMMGGGSNSPDEFNYDIFSFRRITLAPIVVLCGFGFVFWAIMRKPKKKEE